MTKAVLFDFYGTLARAGTWGPTHEEVLARHGYRVDEPAREAWRSEIFDGQEHLEHSVDRERYVAWERDRLARMVAACDVGPDNLDRLRAAPGAAAQAVHRGAVPEAP